MFDGKACQLQHTVGANIFAFVFHNLKIVYAQVGISVFFCEKA